VYLFKTLSLKGVLVKINNQDEIRRLSAKKKCHKIKPEPVL
jgi:hypothetical protein